MRYCRAALSAVFLLILAACGGSPGQNSTPPSGDVPARARVSDAASLPLVRYHVLPRRQPGARLPQITYPGDLTYNGGYLVTAASSHNVYLNCTFSCWGDPQEFLDLLDNSSLTHVVDQYVGTTANHRYRSGPNVAVTMALTNNFIAESDILNLLHHAASLYGSGYGHIYHVFLPQGVDTCIGGTTQCYSPDNPSQFTLCAYHASVQYGDGLGHVLFTVEPYQAVTGCEESTTVNGTLIDSTDSTLSHELFETITDPDPDTGWYNANFGDEMGDLCQPFRDPIALYHARRFEIQEEYSNKVHGCIK